MTRQNDWDFEKTFAVNDLLYADTTSTLAKLSIGANGETLTVDSGLPSYQEIKNRGDLLFVKSVSASNAASIDVTSIGGYRNYIAILHSAYPHTNERAFWMRFSNDNGSTFFTTNYRCSITVSNSGDLAAGTGGGIDTRIELSTSAISHTAIRSYSTNYLFNFNQPSRYAKVISLSSVYLNTTTRLRLGRGRGTHSTANINAFRILCSGGNITGTVDLYAVLT